MKVFHALAIASLASTVALATEANAAVTINIQEVGGDVVATTGGTLNITGLSTVNVGSGTAAGVAPLIGLFSAVQSSGVTFYSGLSGSGAFGPGGSLIFATSSAGTPFYINSTGAGLLGLPNGYVSGAPLAASTTFAGQTFASLGVTPGTYVYTVLNDTITLNVGGLSAAVPEPATWAMLILGFGAVGGVMRRRSGAATASRTRLTYG